MNGLGTEGIEGSNGLYRKNRGAKNRPGVADRGDEGLQQNIGIKGAALRVGNRRYHGRSVLLSGNGEQPGERLVLVAIFMDGYRHSLKIEDGAVGNRS